MLASNLKERVNQPAFTLAEVLVVLGIVIMIALISIPLFRSDQQNLELKSSAKLFVTHLRLAQQKTVGEQVTYLIKLFSFPDRYRLIKRTTGDETILEQRLTTGIIWQNKGNFTNNEIIFTTNGAVAQSGIVTLQNVNSHTISIDIKPSGYVKIN